MTRAAQLAVLIAAILLLALFSLWPDPAASEQPVPASRIPTAQFVPLRGVGSLSGTNVNPRRPGLVRTTSPSASAVPSVTPVRLPAARAVVPAASTTGTIRGIASTYGPAFGPQWLALPEGAGVRVEICGQARCIVRVSNDAGPDLAMQREGRVVDLSVRDFEAVTGTSWRRGLAWVTVRRMEP